MICCGSLDLQELSLRILHEYSYLEYKPNIQNHMGQTPLMWSIFNRLTQVTHYLLTEVEDCGVECMDNDEDTALILAIGIQDSLIVRLILEKVSVDHVMHANKMQITAMELAQEFGNEEIITLLFEKLKMN